MSKSRVLQFGNLSPFAALCQNPVLVLLLLVVSIIVCFIDPFREMITEDDGFSYARTVRHLLETGEYQLDNWAAANPPAQIFVAAGLAKLFGYSIKVMVVSTLVLLSIGLLSLYFLLRDFGISDRKAAVLTFGIFSSPPVLLLSFSFMTDVQFMGWMTAAIWLYARAIRRKSLWLMALASVPGAAAIGTRQFGVVLLGGLTLAWLLCEERLRTAPLFLVGVPAPLLAAGWQIWAGVKEPNFTQLVRLREQALYMSQGITSLAGEFVWRPVVLLEYIGIFLVPLLPIYGFLIYAAAKYRKPGDAEHRCARSNPSLNQWLLTAWAIVVSVGLIYSFFNSEWVGGAVVRSPVMPSTPWLVENWFLHMGIWQNVMRYPLTVFAVLSAIGLGWLILLYAKRAYQREISSDQDFIIATFLLMLALHFIFFNLNDTYTIAFLPLVVFVLSQLLHEHSLPQFWLRTTIAWCLVIVILSSLVIRGRLERQEAMWTVAEALRANGVDSMQIKGDIHWNFYHSAFDKWIDEAGAKASAEQYAGPYRMHSAFGRWLAQRLRDARYTIESACSPPSCGNCSPGSVAEYRNPLFRRCYVYATTNIR